MSKKNVSKSPFTVSDPLSICISSIYQREKDFDLFRKTAADIIDAIPICIARRAPEVVTLEEFKKILRTKAVCLVVLLGERKSRVVEEETKIALDRGIPIIPLVKPIQKGKKLHASPAAKIFFKKYPTLFDARYYFSNCEELGIKLKEGLWKMVREQFQKTPIFTQNRSRSYEEVASLLMKSHPRRIILVQNTSILILGPRKGDPYELSCYNLFYNFLEKFQRRRLELYHLFSWSYTKNEVKKYKDRYNFNKAFHKIRGLLKSKISNRRVHICHTEEQITPLLIVDNSIGVGMSFGTKMYPIILPTILSESESITNFIGNLREMKTKPLTISDIKELEETYTRSHRS